MDTVEFSDLIEQKGQELFRDMPWRQDTRPYYILVSELMLQQTQVDRVVPKFQTFIEAFPNEGALAQASLAEVLMLWQGLGYNRRAKYLQLAAQRIIDQFNGLMPDKLDDLLALPGVGHNTAGAIMAYAFNQPVVFIETNIRTVYFHHFFDQAAKVADADIIPLIEQTLDHQQPRQFYWALMDYGWWLKRRGLKNVSQSKHYKKQSALSGSLRQVRGQLIKRLTESQLSVAELEAWAKADERVKPALAGLVKDGLVEVGEEQVKLGGAPVANR
jgi:A/G-specific adenine glycosylase